MNMSFLKMIFKNPFRNKSRSFLTILGITVGIITIVALGMVSTGLENSINEVLATDTCNVSVIGEPTSLGYGIIPSGVISNISNMSEVNKLAQGSDVSLNLKHNNLSSDSSYGLGIASDNIGLSGFQKKNLIEGKMYKNNSNEMIVGEDLASSLDLKVGDTVNVQGTKYNVSGIFKSGLMSMYSVYLPLESAQNLSATNGSNYLYISLKDNVNSTNFKNSLNNKYNDSNFSITTSEDMLKQSQDVMGTINLAIWGISLLAIFVGALGVINTMLMSVHERTKEIGVLKAVGWKNKRILFMILSESIVVTIVATVIGIIIGFVGMTLISSSGLLPIENMALSASTIINAFLVAIIVGLIGGFIPAYRATKLEPTEALKYE